MSDELATLKAALTTAYVSLFMDGRNEHGTHLLLAGGGTSIFDPDDFIECALHPRDETAEAVFVAAENLGHQEGHNIVARVRQPKHEEDCWEFLGIDEVLTAVFHGTAAEQAANMAAYVDTPEATKFLGV